MISDHAVTAAENAIAARKITIANQWRSLQARSVEAATRPTTLGTLALVGAVVGWRAGGRDVEQAASNSARCTCEDKASAVSDSGTGVIKAAMIGLLKGLATMATEEFVRGFVPADDDETQRPQSDSDNAEAVHERG